MTRRDYDRLERQAKEEMERGIRLLRSACEARLRAIRVLRLMGSGPQAAGLGQDATPAEVETRDAARSGRLQRAFSSIFAGLPSEFTKSHVLAALHEHAPEAGADTNAKAVSALLIRLSSDPDSPIDVKVRGVGRAPTIYCKVAEAEETRETEAFNEPDF